MVKNVNIRVYPDNTFGYIVEVSNNLISLPVATMGTLTKAFELVESKSFENFVEVFFAVE